MRFILLLLISLAVFSCNRQEKEPVPETRVVMEEVEEVKIEEPTAVEFAKELYHTPLLEKLSEGSDVPAGMYRIKLSALDLSKIEDYNFNRFISVRVLNFSDILIYSFFEKTYAFKKGSGKNEASLKKSGDKLILNLPYEYLPKDLELVRDESYDNQLEMILADRSDKIDIVPLNTLDIVRLLLFSSAVKKSNLLERYDKLGLLYEINDEYDLDTVFRKGLVNWPAGMALLKGAKDNVQAAIDFYKPLNPDKACISVDGEFVSTNGISEGIYALDPVAVTDKGWNAQEIGAVHFLRMNLFCFFVSEKLIGVSGSKGISDIVKFKKDADKYPFEVVGRSNRDKPYMKINSYSKGYRAEFFIEEKPSGEAAMKRLLSLDPFLKDILNEEISVEEVFRLTPHQQIALLAYSTAKKKNSLLKQMKKLGCLSYYDASLKEIAIEVGNQEAIELLR